MAIGAQLDGYDADQNKAWGDLQQIIRNALRTLANAMVNGPQAAPPVPASTTTFANPFSFPCLVTILGTGVTAVALNGILTGIVAGTLLLPTNGTLTLTYPLTAPVWFWYGLS